MTHYMYDESIEVILETFQVICSQLCEEGLCTFLCGLRDCEFFKSEIKDKKKQNKEQKLFDVTGIINRCFITLHKEVSLFKFHIQGKQKLNLSF